MKNTLFEIEKGFTIIEILLTLALLSVVLLSLFSFYSYQNNIFYKINNDIELMQQSQFILEFMEDKLIETSEIIYIEDIAGKARLETSDIIILKKIIVKNNICNKDRGYIFQLRKDSISNTYNLKYGIGLSGSATVEVGNYIEKIEISPINPNRTFKESNGVKIHLLMNVNGYRKNFESQLYFRNSHRRYY